MRNCALVLAAMATMALCLSAGCAEPLEFADWTIPVPEGTRIIEYAAVPIEGRIERIELVEDLVLGADDTDPNQLFYRPTDVAIDKEGKMFVVDSGNHRIQVFDAGGSFVMTLGREGEGPGEFTQALSATVIGDRLLVNDRGNMRVSIWSTDGTHLEDVGLGFRLRSVSFYAGVDAGYAVILYSTRGEEPGSQNFALGAWSLDGEETIQYIEMPLDRTPTLQRGARRTFISSNPRAHPTFAAARNGNVYITPGDEYQVLALDPEGRPRWAIRVAWKRPVMSQEFRQTILERVRNAVPDVTEAEINYLDRLPSISRLAVDGEGHLFVYPYVPPGPGAEGVVDVPVDVYSSKGELIFSGMMPGRGWRRADGDFVYAAGLDRVSGEYRVWRWRLVEPFE